jgi:hypothetical protein
METNGNAAAHRSLYGEKLEAAAEGVKQVKANAALLALASDQMRTCIEKIEAGLRAIGEVDRTRQGMEERQRIYDRCQRLRELRNMMELGAFEISVTNAMDEAWRRLP